MKKNTLVLALLLTGTVAFIANAPLNIAASAQSINNNELYYTFQGQRIPLQQRQDVIAVAFKKTRTRGESPIIQLEKDLQTGLRNTSKIEVTPLGDNYAVVNLPTGIRDGGIQQRIQQRPYVETTLPVLTRKNSQEIIALPNEIIVTFQVGLSDSEKQAILKQNNLAIIRPLRFNPNHYLVKSINASGTQILSITNKLTQVKGINSATPNFIQTVSGFPGQDLKLPRTQTNNKQDKEIYPAPNYLGLQWYLDSTPLKQCLQQKESNYDSLQSCLKTQTAMTKSTSPRTDLRVVDAWKHSNRGRGVVVAVLDSAIQWNHPDLANSLYTVTATDKCPGEVHGWDFSSASESSKACDIGDPDTRLNDTELTFLSSKFRNTFLLTDAEILQSYLELAQQVKKANPQASDKQIAQFIRYYSRAQVGSEFHGTWVSGVIAAKPAKAQGVIGVAPNAKILPVRVFGLNGSIFLSGYIEAIGYAAARGADVINLSLGAPLPTDAEATAFDQILEAHPKLVVVASSGNENNATVAYPSAYPGVISVGATNIVGNRAPYSNFGNGLNLVAPGGDIESEPGLPGGIVTTGGTWLDEFWRNVPNPNSPWGNIVDLRGKYWSVEGTSFSSPAVAGVVALMKGEDPNRRLNREQIIDILKSTSSYEALTLSPEEIKRYRSQVEKGAVPTSITDKQYFFGSGLVNADAAVRTVQKK